MATRTSNSTNTRAATPTCCLRNLRQNSPQGVRTLVAVLMPAFTAVVCVMAASFVAYGGVDEAMDHVHDQVDQDELEREQQDQRLDAGIVARADPSDQQPAQPGPVEDRRANNGAAQQEAELQPHHGDHGTARVAQRLLDDDDTL